MKRRYLFIALALFLSTYILEAQEPSFDLKYRNDTITLGKAMYLTYSLKNIDSDFHFSDIDGCLVIRPAQRSNIQIINGEKSSSKEFDIIVKPLSIGEFTIPPITIFHKDDSFNAEGVTLVVIPDPDKPDETELDFNDNQGNDQLPVRPQPEKKKKKKELPPGTKIIRT